jgi:hypothetical protein
LRERGPLFSGGSSLLFRVSGGYVVFHEAVGVGRQQAVAEVFLDRTVADAGCRLLGTVAKALHKVPTVRAVCQRAENIPFRGTTEGAVGSVVDVRRRGPIAQPKLRYRFLARLYDQVWRSGRHPLQTPACSVLERAGRETNGPPPTSLRWGSPRNLSSQHTRPASPLH